MGSQMLRSQVVTGPVNSGNNMDFRQLYLAWIYISRVVLSQPLEPLKTCQFKTNGETYQINQGEVTEIKKTKVRVCDNGKNILKLKTEFRPPYKFGCEGCTVKGKIVCKGTIVRDLYRWWFLAQCDRGRMLPIGRQWSEVVSDPRFQEVRCGEDFV